MCGIIGYTGSRSAAPFLLEGLSKLEYRGYDSAGIAVCRPGGRGTTIVRREGKLVGLAEQLRLEPVEGVCGIGHTRWATHGRPSETNAHPHRVGKVSVVHNGIIENHLELRHELIGRGRVFSSETDTEIFAHLIDDALTSGAASDLRTAVQQGLTRVRGTWALCVIHDDTPGEIVAAKHAAPLLIGLAGSSTAEPEHYVASDVSAILAATRQVVDLEDGDVAVLRPAEFKVFDAAGEVVQRPERRIDWSPAAAEKQGFRHFMLKEIHEQPGAISDTLLGRISLEQADVNLDGLELGAKWSRVLIVACGTSHHAAMAGKYAIERLARLQVEVDLASEFRYRDPVLGPDVLAVFISQSGETADTLAALQEAKRLGARTLAVCNVIGSSIARAADHVVYTHAGPEISVASTKAFTTQLVMMSLLAIYLGRRRGTLDDGAVREHLEGLSRVPDAVATLLEQLSALRVVARRYAGARDVLFLGRGLGYPVALEGALKLKEISYVHAEGYASGEMKHGPIALIDAQVPVVVLAQKGEGYEKVLSNLEEVRARGGRIVAIATAGDTRIADLADDVILVPEVSWLASPILATIPLQLFAYHVADLKGTDVDQPRNLAKSVTVE